MSKVKILITGGTGFLGYHLAKKCLKRNWIVHSLSTKKPNKIRKIKKVKYLTCDISKNYLLKKKINDNYDYVVNFAGYVDHTNKSKTMDSHYEGCRNLAQIFLKKKIKKFIQIGSCIEYGKIRSPQIEDKVSKKKILSTYGQAKLYSTNFLLDLHKRFKFPVVILRLYLVYGPYQDPNRLIPFTILNSILGKEFNCSEGKQFRDFLYIDDFVEGLIKVLKKTSLSGEIINIGRGKPIKVKDVISKISQIVSTGKPNFGAIKLRKDEIKKLYPDISKAKKLLNWKPKIDINSGLNKTINFYRKKNYTKD